MGKPALTEVVITPQMLQAGVEALADASEASLASQAEAVFQAMISSLDQQARTACETCVEASD